MLRKTLVAGAVTLALSGVALAQTDSSSTQGGTDAIPATQHQQKVIQDSGSTGGSDGQAVKKPADSGGAAATAATQKPADDTAPGTTADTDSTQDSTTGATAQTASDGEEKTLQSDSQQSAGTATSTTVTSTDPVASQTPADDEPGTGAYEVRASDLLGLNIQNAQDEDIGEIDDLIIGADEKLHAVLSIGGFLGIGDRRVVVSFDELQISRGTDDSDEVEVAYNASKADLEAKEPFSYREGDLSWRERMQQRIGDWTDKAKTAVENVTGDEQPAGQSN